EQQVTDWLKKPDGNPGGIAQCAAYAAAKQQPGIPEHFHKRFLPWRYIFIMPASTCCSRRERPVCRKNTSSSEGRASATLVTSICASSNMRRIFISDSSPCST